MHDFRILPKKNDQQEYLQRRFRTFGAYSHGNHYGIIQRSFHHWHTCWYFNSFMRHHGARGQWSSIQLGYDCHIGQHRDAHNLQDSLNWSISFGNFTKGRLWLECTPLTEVGIDGGVFEETVLSDGIRAQGYLHDNRHKMQSFSPKARHAVEQWSGVRCSIVAYTTRGIGEITRQERDVLRSAGFPLGRTEGSEDWEREHCARPKKSVRRSLWKGARRASAMIALGMTASTSFISEIMPMGKPIDQVSLLEVGGNDLTLDTIEAGFRTIEPLTWDDYLCQGLTFDVHETMSLLKPHVLWFQGNAAHHTPEVINRIVATADHQLDLGGIFVYQASASDPFWQRPQLQGLLREQPHTYQESGDDWILRVGVREDDQDEGCISLVGTEHEVNVASNVVPENTTGNRGASAIHFDKNGGPTKVALQNLGGTTKTGSGDTATCITQCQADSGSCSGIYKGVGLDRRTPCQTAPAPKAQDKGRTEGGRRADGGWTEGGRTADGRPSAEKGLWPKKAILAGWTGPGRSPKDAKRTQKDAIWTPPLPAREHKTPFAEKTPLQSRRVYHVYSNML